LNMPVIAMLWLASVNMAAVVPTVLPACRACRSSGRLLAARLS